MVLVPPGLPGDPVLLLVRMFPGPPGFQFDPAPLVRFGVLVSPECLVFPGFLVLLVGPGYLGLPKSR